MSNCVKLTNGGPGAPVAQQAPDADSLPGAIRAGDPRTDVAVVVACDWRVRMGDAFLLWNSEGVVVGGANFTGNMSPVTNTLLPASRVVSSENLRLGLTWENGRED